MILLLYIFSCWSLLWISFILIACFSGNNWYWRYCHLSCNSWTIQLGYRCNIFILLIAVIDYSRLSWSTELVYLVTSIFKILKYWNENNITKIRLHSCSKILSLSQCNLLAASIISKLKTPIVLLSLKMISDSLLDWFSIYTLL